MEPLKATWTFSEFKNKLATELFWSAYAIPLSNISSVQVIDDPMGDTAWYNQLNAQITFTIALARTIFNRVATQADQEAVAKGTYKHEGLHSAQTRFWPKMDNAEAGWIVNHLEDWRINRMPVARDPGYKRAMLLLNTILTASRKEEGFAPKAVKGPAPAFSAFWDSLWAKALSPISFSVDYDRSLETIANPYAKEVAKRAKEPAMRAYEAQPRDIGNFDQVVYASLQCVKAAHDLMDTLDPIYHFRKLEELTRQLKPSQLKDLVKKELERRGLGRDGERSEIPPPTTEKTPPSIVGEKETAIPGESKKSGEDEAADQPAEEKGKLSEDKGTDREAGNSPGGPGEDEFEEKGSGKPGDSKSEGGSGAPQEPGEGNSKEPGNESGTTDEKGASPAEGGKSGKDPGKASGKPEGNEDTEDETRGGYDDFDPHGKSPEDILQHLPGDILADLLDKLESPALTDAPSGSKKVDRGDVEKIESTMGAGSPGEHNPSELKVTPVPADQLLTYRQQCAPLTNRVRRLLANSLADNTGYREQVILPSHSGGSIDVNAVATRLDNPFSDIPMFEDTLPGAFRQARQQVVLDRVYVGVDGSGSMKAEWGQVQQFLFVLNEVLSEEKIPVTFALNHDDQVLLLCNAKDGRDAVGAKLLAFEPEGDRDMAASSLMRLAFSGMDATLPASLKRSRLVIVSDCYCENTDVELAIRGQYNIPFPSSLLAFSDGTHVASGGTVEQIHEKFVSVAKRHGVSHTTIRLAPSAEPSDPIYLGAFKSFCEWCRLPDAFAAAHCTVIDARPAHDLVALTKPGTAPIAESTPSRERDSLEK